LKKYFSSYWIRSAFFSILQRFSVTLFGLINFIVLIRWSLTKEQMGTWSLFLAVTTIFETNLSLQDARLNNVMKKLTGWAAIIAVPTAVTGFYGQNVPYPGFGAHWGFWVSTLVMIVMSLGLYLIFRRRDWI